MSGAEDPVRIQASGNEQATADDQRPTYLSVGEHPEDDEHAQNRHTPPLTQTLPRWPAIVKRNGDPGAESGAATPLAAPERRPYVTRGPRASAMPGLLR
jgi:hypothetical protein